MPIIKLLIQLAIILIISVLFFSFTDPNNLPVGFLMIPVLLIFAGVYLAARIIFSLIPANLFSNSKKLTHSVMLGVIASFIMLFQSTGGIVWTDIILMGLLIIIGYFYINRL